MERLEKLQIGYYGTSRFKKFGLVMDGNKNKNIFPHRELDQGILDTVRSRTCVSCDPSMAEVTAAWVV